MKKRILSVLLCLVMVLWLLPTAAFAETSITYLDKEGSTQCCSNPTEVTSNSAAWTAGWYYVDGDVTISERVTVSGDVYLILTDNATLTASKGIEVSYGHGLTIYAQSIGENQGKLTAVGEDKCAAIGGGADGNRGGGTITINGGEINASAGNGAAIGGGEGTFYERGASGTIIINGGKIDASAGNGAAIGGSYWSNDVNVTINGGVVTASSSRGAGIGGGDSGASVGNILITGGTVTASSSGGAGIGGGYSGAGGGTIEITGGTVTATGGAFAAGIGGGTDGEGQSVTIRGGTVTATGGTFCAGIGGGGLYGSGGKTGGTVLITGGVVRADGYACGIGNGSGAGGGSVTVSGGVVAASINSETFSTGENGDAIIVASGITDDDDTSGWSGLIITSAEGKGKFYGAKTKYIVNTDLEIPSGCALTIKEDQSLTVDSGATLTNRGTIVNNGTLINRGIFKNYGTVSGTAVDSTDGTVQEAPVLALSFESGGETVTNATYGQALTLKVEVTGRSGGSTINTGTVTFYKWNDALGDPVSVSNGVAEYTLTPTGSGWKPTSYDRNKYTIRAKYTSSGGDLLDAETEVKLGVGKGTQTAQPSAPTLSSRTASNVILKEQTVPSELNSSMEYGYGEGSVLPSNWSYRCYFGNLKANTAYTFYARYKENEYYSASSASEGTVICTLREKPQASAVTIDYKAETISFDDTVEVNTAEDFDGTALSSGQSITDYIGSNIYVRLKATEETTLPSEAAKVTIPSRPNNWAWVWAHNRSVNSITIGVSSEYEYRLGEDGAWRSADHGSLTFEDLTAGTTYTFYTRCKATESSFVSAVSSGLSASTLDASGPYSVEWGETITVNGVTVTDELERIVISGPSGTTIISNYAFYPVEAVTVSEDGQISVPGGARITAADGTVTTVPEKGGMVDIGTGAFTENEHTVSFDTLGGSEMVSVTVSHAEKLTRPDNPTRRGYTFRGWYKDANFTEAWDFENDVVTASITLYAKWKVTYSISRFDPAYTVATPETENGSVSVSPKNASKGTTVTVTVTPDKGWTLETLTVCDRDGKEVELDIVTLGEKYTFKMPSGKVTVSATFMEDNTILNYFADVKASDYFYDAVLWAAENGITTGVDDLHFAPNNTCTRAQIVTFLWRAAGSPEPKSVSSFTDVASDSYYAKAVAWAIENGITNGTGNDKFSPDETCTRAQSVTFLARALDGKATANAEFSDVPADSWYAEAVAWAAENGVTEGIGGGLFGSDSDCTRGQIVTFLFRAYVK